MKKTLDFFKKEFAHDAVELKECLQLLSECMDGTIQNISEKAASCFSNRDFEKMKSYQDCVTELDSLQVKLESYMALVDLDDAPNDYDNEEEIITEHAAEKDGRKINYADYAVDENTEYSLIDDFTHKRPAGFKLQNQRYVANDWKDVFVKTCSALAERNLFLFEGLVSDPTMQGKKVVYFAYSPAAMRKPELISGTKIYAHTNLSANQIRNIIQKMLRKFGISTSDYKMYLKADYTSLHNSCDNSETPQTSENSEDTKIGKYIRLKLRELSNQQKNFSANELIALQSKEWCKANLNLDFPIFKKCDPQVDISAQVKIGSYIRYWKEIFEFGGEKFLVTSQWYDRHRNPFDNWLNTL